jgi:hypothetical protein
MPSLKSFETLSQYKKAVLSIYRELGNGHNKHATKVNLIRHMTKNDRHFGKDIVEVFIKQGLLRKYRTDTFCWTEIGLIYCKELLEELEKSEKREPL